MMLRYVSRSAFIALLAVVYLFAPAALAARIAVLSNNGFNAVASDFNAMLTGHTFTGIDVTSITPSLVSLTTSYDAVLLFENGTFGNAPNVGNVVAAFANTGRAVMLGTFYDQDRSDASFGGNWGLLETIDPNTTDGVGTPYALRTLNPGSIVVHPLTAGVASLFSNQFAGGNQAKAGTIVVALWNQLNERSLPDPAIAYRVTGPACVIHVAIFPDYPSFGTLGTDFGGDFYKVWQNAADYAAGHCAGIVASPTAVPALTGYGVALLMTALLVLGIAGRRRLRGGAR